MRNGSTSRQQNDKLLRQAMATEIAKNYCVKHGYNQAKLQTQRYCELPGCICFAQPRGIMPNGLLNDLETQPFPTLVIRMQGEELHVETTEHTDKYLK